MSIINKHLIAKFRPIYQDSILKNLNWFVYMDLNTIFSQRGADFVYRFYAAEVARAKHME